MTFEGVDAPSQCAPAPRFGDSTTEVAGTVDAVVEGSASSTTGTRSSCTSILLPAVGRLGSLRPVLMRSVSIPHICSLSNTGIFVRFGVVRASAFFDRDG